MKEEHLFLLNRDLNCVLKILLTLSNFVPYLNKWNCHFSRGNAFCLPVSQASNPCFPLVTFFPRNFNVAVCIKVYPGHFQGSTGL